LRNHIKLTGLGKVYIAPVDVELAPHTVIEPDVVVVLKEHLEIMHYSRIIGAPDLVVEVASPSTARYDRHEKLNRYAQAGVSEYWIVNPVTQTLEILILENSSYQLLGVFKEQDAVRSKIVPTMADVRVSLFFV
jgi:Uma2 family endonuclease